VTPKLTVSCPCPVDHLWQLASKSVHSFTHYCVHTSRNRQMDERTDNL